MPFITIDVDLTKHPITKEATPTEETTPTNEITIGDLHGNSLLLINLLLQCGILKFADSSQKEALYNQLRELYLHLDQCPKIEYFPDDKRCRVAALTNTKAEIDAFFLSIADIINQLICNKPRALVRLIGDETGDRGANDYLTLLVLQRLSSLDIQVDILLSSHGMEFVEAYERFPERKKMTPTMLGTLFTPSLVRLGTLIEKEMISFETQVAPLIEDYYKRSLKLVSYSVDPRLHEITIFTHAGVGLSTIETLANKLRVTYQDDSLDALRNTIDSINAAFAENVRYNKVHTLYTKKWMEVGFGLNRGPWQSLNNPAVAKKLWLYESRIENNAVEVLIWNRIYQDLDRPETKGHPAYQLRFCHGHDSGEETRGHIINLDQIVGKSTADEWQRGRVPLWLSFSADYAPDVRPMTPIVVEVVPPAPTAPIMPRENLPSVPLVESRQNIETHLLTHKQLAHVSTPMIDAIVAAQPTQDSFSTVPNRFKKLSARLDDMLVYGLLLQQKRRTADSTIAIALAIKLKNSLHAFCCLDPAAQNTGQNRFRADFNQLVHSQDELMSHHHQYWKVIVANILIALTGIGLLAIMGNVAINRQLFFSQTHRQTLLSDLDNTTQEILNAPISSP